MLRLQICPRFSLVRQVECECFVFPSEPSLKKASAADALGRASQPRSLGCASAPWHTLSEPAPQQGWAPTRSSDESPRLVGRQRLVGPRSRVPGPNANPNPNQARAVGLPPDALEAAAAQLERREAVCGGVVAEAERGAVRRVAYPLPLP